MADEPELLHTQNTTQTLTLAGVGGIGLALMFGGGTLTYGGYGVALIFSGLIGFLHRREIVSVVTTRRGWKHLAIPCLAIGLLVLGGAVIFYRRTSAHPLTLFQFLAIAWTLVLGAAWRVVIDPVSWFVLFVLWAFVIANTQPKPNPEAAFGPDVDAALAHLKSKIADGSLGSNIDFRVWDQIQTFPLVRVAYLWVNQVPPGGDIPYPDGKALEQCLVLLDAVREGTLEIDHLENLSSHEQDAAFYVGAIQRAQLTLPVTRTALRAYAEEIGQRPPFLFPEARTPPPPLGRSPALIQWSKATSYQLSEAAALWVDALPSNAMSAEAVAVLAKGRQRALVPRWRR